MINNQTEKKTDGFFVRMGTTEKKSFLKVCANNGHTPTAVLRESMKQYIKNYGTEKLNIIGGSKE